jgi:hypothetical protein
MNCEGMRRNNYIFSTFFLILLFSGFSLSGQETSRTLRAGISVGMGSQQLFPYDDPDYTHECKSLKGLFNYELKRTGRISCELQIEPGLFLAKHQLLNEFFIQPESGADYLQQRVKYSFERTITEIAVNAGILVRYNSGEKLGFFILGSIGPMYSDSSTERLAGGFAFSDIIEAGVSYNTGKIMFEIRPGLRHTSNADLWFPNSGHNSTTIDFGLSFIL